MSVFHRRISLHSLGGRSGHILPLFLFNSVTIALRWFWRVNILPILFDLDCNLSCCFATKSPTVAESEEMLLCLLSLLLLLLLLLVSLLFVVPVFVVDLRLPSLLRLRLRRRCCLPWFTIDARIESFNFLLVDVTVEVSSSEAPPIGPIEASLAVLIVRVVADKSISRPVS